MTRRGFGLVEVVVALTVLAVGALGAAALIAHAALSAGAAARREDTVRHAVELLDSLAHLRTAPPAGMRVRRGVVYEWRAADDTTGRVVEVVAVLRTPPDTIRLRVARPAPLPMLIADR